MQISIKNELWMLLRKTFHITIYLKDMSAGSKIKMETMLLFLLVP